MANVNPYYVGTTLSDIGSNMSRDRGYEAQQAIAQMQARQQQAAQIRQAMMERERMAQQQQQFQQEMAYRNANMGQDAAYRNSVLGLKERELNASLSGFNPRDVADNNYRYAALENAREIEKLRQQSIPQGLAVERERQAGLNLRELAAAQEAWDYNKSSAESKTSQYNALVDEIDKEAKLIEKRKTWGMDDPDTRKALADKKRQEKYAELNQILQLDKRPGDITQDPITKKFQPVLPPRPGGRRVEGTVNPDISNNPVGFVVPQAGAPATSTQPLPPAGIADRPIKVRTSDGQIWDTTSSRFALFKRRDPGAVMINPAVPQNTGGATGSWGAPSHYSNPSNIDALLRALN